MTDNYASAGLSKDERDLYVLLHRVTGRDHTRFLSSRRLEFPAYHYAVMAELCAHVGSEELAEADVEDLDRAVELMDQTDELMQKMSNALIDAGLEEQAMEILEDKGTDRWFTEPQ